MSWLQLKEKQKKLHQKNCISVAVDFEKYLCKDFRVSTKLIQDMGFTGETDQDNSNSESLPDNSALLKNTNTANGHAYNLIVNLPGFAPITVIDIEMYRDSHAKTLNCDGSVIFYGAFFRFRELLKEQAPYCEHLYQTIRRLATNKPDAVYRRNRIDVAIDVTLPVDQKWEYEYIVPFKTSKRVVHHYNFKKELWGWQSFGYLSAVNRGIWIRVYNKCLDIIAKNKQSWYPDIDSTKDIVTRIELQFNTPYSESDDFTIISLAKYAILWNKESSIHKLHYVNPLSSYSPLSAHKYISRYAKNHWKDLNEILYDISEIQYSKQNSSLS